MANRKLYNDDVAALLGITPATWRRYNAATSNGHRRQAPPPDGTDIQRGHARPWWWETTIRTWQASRPGPGTRTDLKRPKPADG
jgi:hypothetical protein